MTSREQFEAAYNSGEIYRLEVDSAVRFEDYKKQCAWASWQASRAALVVELPQPMKSPPYASYEGGWNDMRGEATEVLEAAGVRVAQ